MAGALGTIATLTVLAGAMLSVGMKIGLLDKPSLSRCAACGRLRRRGVCPCSDGSL